MQNNLFIFHNIFFKGCKIQQKTTKNVCKLFLSENFEHFLQIIPIFDKFILFIIFRITLHTFFDVKKCLVLMKENLFDSNKISLNQINICSNQINFCLKSNKFQLWPYINALIFLFWRKINLIQRYFVWIKQILFYLKKSFLQIKESRSNKSFSLIQSNFFSECWMTEESLIWSSYWPCD